MLTSKNITIIIPSYNSSSCIEACIMSVLDQTCVPKSIIVIDDCSDDIKITTNIINSLNKTNKIKINLIINKKNIGPGLSRNKAWKQAKTDLVGFLDADDVYYKNKLECQIEVLNKFPDASVIAGKKNIKNEPLKYEIALYKTISLSFYSILFFNSIATSSVLIKKNIISRFNNTYYCEDYYLWLSVLHKRESIILIDSNVCSQNLNHNHKYHLSSNLLKMEAGAQKIYLNLYSKNFLLNIVILISQIFSILRLIKRIIYRKVLVKIKLF